MQNTKANKFEERAQHWRAVIARANDYPGSCHAFCVSEGITKSNFYNWRQKLNGVKTKKKSTLPLAFARVAVVEPRAVDLKKIQRQTIDARWVAEFILHLHSEVNCNANFRDSSVNGGAR